MAGQSALTPLTMGKALTAGLRSAMARDDRVLIMGEDIGRLGGVFRITDGLQDEFGAGRVIDTPWPNRASSARPSASPSRIPARRRDPVRRVRVSAFDQMMCQVAKLHYRTRGQVRMPITIRIPWAGGVGAAEHHSESPEAYFVHTAGLRVVAVSNPHDAYTMLQQTIACDDPVVFFEPKRLYHTKGEVDLAADIADAAPMGLARVAREGTDVTLVAYGAQVTTALDAAGGGRRRRDLDRGHRSALALARRLPHAVGLGTEDRPHGRDPRGGRRSGRGRRAHREHHRAVLPPPRSRAGAGDGHDIPYPPAKLEKHHVPDLDGILDAVDRVVDRPNSLSEVAL